MSELLPGLGPKSGVPSLSAGFDWGKLDLDPNQGFVLSRVDGHTSLGQICLIAPLPEEQTVAILGYLHRVGAIDIPGVPRPAPVSAPAPAPDPAPADDIDLPPDLRARIDDMLERIRLDRPFALLEVEPGVDKKELRRSYFRLSKEFHPDRYFGRRLGPYQRRLQELFTAISAAFELLSDDVKRAEEEKRARAGS